MIKIILKKFLQCLIAVFLLSIVVFYMARLSPGDPLEAYYGNAIERMNKEQKESAMEKLGLNSPIHVQYGKWIKGITKGDFGISYKYKRDVKAVIGDVCLNTIILGGIAYISTFLLALLLGTVGTFYGLKAINIKNNVEIISGGAGLIFTILSFLILKKNDKKFRDSKEYIPIVTRIIVSSGSELNL